MHSKTFFMFLSNLAFCPPHGEESTQTILDKDMIAVVTGGRASTDEDQELSGGWQGDQEGELLHRYCHHHRLTSIATNWGLQGPRSMIWQARNASVLYSLMSWMSRTANAHATLLTCAYGPSESGSSE